MRFRLFALAAALACGAQAAQVEDLAWISGSWRGTLDGSLIEETWSEPGDHLMLGMFRMMHGGRIGFAELMTIEQAGGNVLLRIRHFGQGLAPRDEATPVFRLVSHEDGRAVFRLIDMDKAERLIYQRTPEGGLAIVLEKDRDGATTRQEFVFRRQNQRPGAPP